MSLTCNLDQKNIDRNSRKNQQLLDNIYSLVVTYSFLSVPLFIFMASLLERSNIARDLYDALNAWLRKTRGGVGVVTAIKNSKKLKIKS